MNYLIEALSKINSRPQKIVDSVINYQSEDGHLFSGYQTNEAPTKYLMWFLANKNEIVDSFIVLVTPNCMKDIVPSYEVTTFQYYENYLIEYTKQICVEFPKVKEIIDNKYGSVDNYIKSCVKPVNVSTESNKEELSKMMQELFKVTNNSIDNAKIYVDFTGGSRISCLVMLMFIRVLNDLGADVSKIVYANLLSSNKTIVDCTASYDVFKLIKASGNNMDNFYKELQEWSLATKEQIDNTKQISNIIEEEKNDINIHTEEEKNKKIRELEEMQRKQDTKSIVGQLFSKKIENTKNSVKNTSAFQKLSQEIDKDLIKDFYENIIGMFIDKDVIKCTRHFTDTGNKTAKDKAKETVKASIEASSTYLLDEDSVDSQKKNNNNKPNYIPKKSSVILTVKNWLKILRRDLNKSPIKLFEERTWFSDPSYSDYKIKYPCGINKDKLDKFISYTQKKSYTFKATFNIDYFKMICNWMNLFYNYGFPFACVDKKGNLYLEVTDYYVTKVKDLIEELDNKKTNDIDQYKRDLDLLIDNNGELENRIPQLMKISCWEINDAVFNSGNESSAFLNTLLSRLEKVRPYRNAICHRNNNEKFVSIVVQKNIADEIRLWLKEYDNMQFGNKSCTTKKGTGMNTIGELLAAQDVDVQTLARQNHKQ